MSGGRGMFFEWNNLFENLFCLFIVFINILFYFSYNFQFKWNGMEYNAMNNKMNYFKWK